MSIQYYNRDGSPMVAKEGESQTELTLRWARMFENGKNRIVRQTRIFDHFVSTVFLGLNHNFNALDERPLIFETMVFVDHDDTKKRHDIFQDRYATEHEAKIGHWNTVLLFLWKAIWYKITKLVHIPYKE